MNKIIFFVIVFLLMGLIFFGQSFAGEKQKMEISLKECVKIALANAFEVKLAKLDLYISETDVMYKEAVFDMFINGGASYEEDKRQQLSVFASDDMQENIYYGEIEKTIPTGTELGAKLADTRSWENSSYISKNPSHEAELSFEIKQPIGRNLFGYIDRNKITLAKLAVKNASLDTRERIEKMTADVEKAYWELVYAERSLEIYNEMLEKARQLYGQDKKNYEMGMAEEVDLLASRANVSKIEAETLIVANDYQQAEENLKLTMNIESDGRIDPMDSLRGSLNEPELAGCLKTALKNRRDYLAGRRDVDIKGLSLKVKANNKWPEIDLTATMAMNGLEEKFGHAMTKTTVVDNVDYFAGVEVKIPVENSQARSEYKKAQFEKEKALLDLKRIERAIITEVANAVSKVSALERSLVFMEEAVSLESKKLEEEEKRFNYGRSDTKTLIDYQQDLLRARLDETKFLLRHKQALVDLSRVMNVLLEKYEDFL